MAARKEKITHDDKTKHLIRASQLLNRLNSFANNEIEMTQAQVNTAKMVIGKAAPERKGIEQSGQGADHRRRGGGWT